MARAQFRETFTLTGGDGKLTPISGLQIRIFQPGSTTAVNVYSSRSPADVTALPQPITTGVSGTIAFWAEVGDYDIEYKDTRTPARVATARIGWSSVSGADRGIPSVKLASDGAVEFAAFAAAAQMQFAPLGAVLEWWRPSTNYDAGAGAGAAPPGYEDCVGQTLAAGQHEMGAGSITLPDLRNKFILGADRIRANGAASVANDAAFGPTVSNTSAPGIAGAGGSNALHKHAVAGHKHSRGSVAVSDPGHGHAVTDPGHVHPFESYGQGGGVTFNGAPSVGGNVAHTANSDGQGGTATALKLTNQASFFGGIRIASSGAGISINSGGTGISLTGTVGNTGGSDGDAGFDTSTTDGRPAFVGLLRIMKVRRT